MPRKDTLELVGTVGTECYALDIIM